MARGVSISVALIAVSAPVFTATVYWVFLLLDRLGLIKTHDLFHSALLIGAAMTVPSLANAVIYYRRQLRRGSRRPYPGMITILRERWATRRR